MHRVRYKSPDLCAQATYRRCGGDIQRVVILVSTSQIGGLFGHDDCREMVPLRIPNPNSLGSHNKEVSLLVDFDSVGDTVMRFPLLVTENPAVCKISNRRDVVHANIFSLAVVHIKVLTIERECRAIRLS